MGREQIENRLKEIKEENFYASDLLAVILKSHGKIRIIIKNYNLENLNQYFKIRKRSI